MSTVIGIDLGTSFAVVGAWVHDKVEILPSLNNLGYVIPSYVAFLKETNEIIFGDEAKS